METESSSPCSQQPATFPYLKPHDLRPSTLILFQTHFNIFPSTSRSSKRFLFFSFRHQNPLCTSPHMYEPFAQSNLPFDMITYIFGEGVRGSAVGWGTALQVGRSRVRFPMASLHFCVQWRTLVVLDALVVKVYLLTNWTNNNKSNNYNLLSQQPGG